MVEDANPPIPKESSPELTSFLMQCFMKDFKNRPNAEMLLKHTWIVSNASQSKIKKEELEGKLKAVNKQTISGGGYGHHDENTLVKKRIQEVREELKSMRLDQQKLQIRILNAKKTKTELAIEINKLKQMKL